MLRINIKVHIIVRVIALVLISNAINALDIKKQNLFETEQRFHPKYGKNGAVSSQESNATKVGLKVLQQGGNAVDAAVAVGYSLAVTLPRAGNLGGGGFMTIWMNKEKKAYVINYREVAPNKINIEEIKNLSGDEFTSSHKSSGVPGTVAGLNLAHSKFGSMKLADLIQPAITLAADGFSVTESAHESFNYFKQKLLKDPEAKRIFYKQPDPSINKYFAYELGEVIKQPDLAETLQRIAEYGNEGFYTGKTAKLIEQAMLNDHGYISGSDLINYKAEIVKPIITKYGDYDIILPPSPSSGGITVSQILKLGDILDLNEIKPNTAKYYHYLTEIFNLAYLDRNYKLGDSKLIKTNDMELLSDDYIYELSKKINIKFHVPSKDIDPNASLWKEGTNTTHFVVIDKDLNVVSNTYTINYSFGNGKVIPGAGFFMNNELDDFTVKVGGSNGYGLIQGENNIIAPNKQPLSSMTPLIVLDKDKKPYLATGTPGGSKIITTVSQVLLNSLHHKYNISTAVSLPRIHSQLWPDVLYFEQGISDDTIELLEKMGHKTMITNSIGSAQSLQIKEPYFLAAADPRRTGALALTY